MKKEQLEECIDYCIANEFYDICLIRKLDVLHGQNCIQILDRILKEKILEKREDLIMLAFSYSIAFERKINERLEFMDMLSSIEDKEERLFLRKLLCDPYILKHRTMKDQLRLIEKITNEKDHKKREDLIKLACDLEILKKRNIEDQIKLMDRVAKEEDPEKREDLITIANDPHILMDFDIEGQLSIMNKIAKIEDREKRWFIKSYYDDDIFLSPRKGDPINYSFRELKWIEEEANKLCILSRKDEELQYRLRKIEDEELSQANLSKKEKIGKLKEILELMKKYEIDDFSSYDEVHKMKIKSYS